MIKLILLIIFAILAVFFIGFNLGETFMCNIWFFHTFENVPVSMVVLISFLAGVILTVPFCLIHRGKSKKSPASAVSEAAPSSAASEKKKSRFGKKEAKKADIIYSDTSSVSEAADKAAEEERK
ncbi:MAG: LapA family protein [Treponemataceae bacterium]|nr:LapA family protein [Treponemataceae bacterium]